MTDITPESESGKFNHFGAETTRPSQILLPQDLQAEDLQALGTFGVHILKKSAAISTSLAELEVVVQSSRSKDPNSMPSQLSASDAIYDESDFDYDAIEREYERRRQLSELEDGHNN